MALDLDPAYFAGIASEHFFYTPSRVGQSVAGRLPVGKDRKTIEKWLERFLALTTYEIACPVLRDSSLAPAGKTGLIISMLFDYSLTKHIDEQGWYEDFKSFCEGLIIRTLDTTIFPDISKKILLQFSSTPLTMATHAGNTDGAIVGWAFTNKPMPAENRSSDMGAVPSLSWQSDTAQCAWKTGRTSRLKETVDVRGAGGSGESSLPSPPPPPPPKPRASSRRPTWCPSTPGWRR